MTQTISITPKWQIYIPVAIREKIGLEHPGKAKVKAKNGKIIIQLEESKVLKMAGKYADKQPKKEINLEKIRKHIDYSNL